MKELPGLGELVVVKIDKIFSYGLRVSLLEYEGVSGFVHISQVSSSWVKNIRNFVKENQIKIAKVVNLRENQIDLSFAKVSPQQEKRLLKAWRENKRALKLLEIFARENKIREEELLSQLDSFFRDYESYYEALKNLSLEPEEERKIPEPIREKFVLFIRKNIVVPKRKLTKKIRLFYPTGYGVEKIRELLLNLKKKFKLDVVYEGSNKFSFVIETAKPKEGDKKLSAALEFLKKEAPNTARLEILK